MPDTAEPAFSICVYLGSRHGDNPRFAQAATAVGRWIGERGGQLAGGRVLGVIPQALVDKELANHQCDELHIVKNMHERKAMMAERCDAFIALPGGIGTFEELFEVWTWRQLGYHDKPLGLLNVDGYYDGLLAFLRTSVQSGLMSDWQMGLLSTHTEVDALLRTLVQQAGNNMDEVPLREVI